MLPKLRILKQILLYLINFLNEAALWFWFILVSGEPGGSPSFRGWVNN